MNPDFQYALALWKAGFRSFWRDPEGPGTVLTVLA
jgi:hypothetical protein